MRRCQARRVLLECHPFARYGWNAWSTPLPGMGGMRGPPFAWYGWNAWSTPLPGMGGMRGPPPMPGMPGARGPPPMPGGLGMPRLWQK